MLCAFILILTLFLQEYTVYAAVEETNGVVTINKAYVAANGNEIVIRNGVERIIVEEGVNVEIALYSVSIDDSGQQTEGSPVIIRGNSYVTLSLIGSSVLKAGYNQYRVGYAGIYVEKGSTLNLNGPGELHVTGGMYGNEPSSLGGAGIGGGAADNTVTVDQVTDASKGGSSGGIRINSGTVTARGGSRAAGIGGGCNGAPVGGILITGGTITAAGGDYAAGIGDGDSVKEGSEGTTNPEFYTSSYTIEVQGGNITASGGSQASGIGSTDEIGGGGNLTGQKSRMQIVLSGGSIHASSGYYETTEGAAAAIGSGLLTVMEDNSITVGVNADIQAVSYGQYAVNQSYATEETLPIINIDPEAYMLMARFAEAGGDREVTVYEITKDEQGNILSKREIAVYTVPEGYRALALTLPGPGTYSVEGIGEGEAQVDIPERSGAVSGKITDGDFIVDDLSEGFTDIGFYKAGTTESAVNSSYQFDPADRSYDVYVPEGTEAIDIYAEWTAIGSAQIYVAGTEMSGQSAAGNGTVYSFDLDDSGETVVYFSKRDYEGNTYRNMISYRVVIHTRKTYNLGVSPMDKVYDGEAVSPSIDQESLPNDTVILDRETGSEDVIEQTPEGNFEEMWTSFPGGVELEYQVLGVTWESKFITAESCLTYDAGTKTVTLTMYIYVADESSALDSAVENGSFVCRLVGTANTTNGVHSLRMYDAQGNHDTDGKMSVSGGSLDLTIELYGSEAAGFTYNSKVIGGDRDVRLLSYDFSIEDEVVTALEDTRTDAYEAAMNGNIWSDPVPYVYHKESTQDFVTNIGIKENGLDNSLTSEQRVITSTRTISKTGYYDKEPAFEMELEYSYYRLNEQGKEILLAEAPSSAGKYRFEARGTTDAYDAVGVLEFTISQRPLTITGVENYRKAYDGTTNPPEGGVGEIYFENLVEGDTVRIEAANVGYKTSETGSGTDYLKLAGVRFDGSVGEDWRNYKLVTEADQTVSVYGEIYYRTDEAPIFIKGENDADPWRKYYPTDSTEPEQSNEMEIAVRASTKNKGEEGGVYAFDMDFGDMKFSFTRSVWNPQIHEYIKYGNGAWTGYDGDNNRISITNRSNKAIKAKFSADIDFPVDLGGLEGYFSESTEQTGAQITESVIDRAQEGGMAGGKDVYFYFNDQAPQMEESTYYVPIGTLTVEFRPDSQDGLKK